MEEVAVFRRIVYPIRKINSMHMHDILYSLHSAGSSKLMVGSEDSSAFVCGESVDEGGICVSALEPTGRYFGFLRRLIDLVLVLAWWCTVTESKKTPIDL